MVTGGVDGQGVGCLVEATAPLDVDLLAFERGDLLAEHFTAAIGAPNHQGGKQRRQLRGVFQMYARYANQGAGLLNLLQGNKA